MLAGRLVRSDTRWLPCLHSVPLASSSAHRLWSEASCSGFAMATSQAIAAPQRSRANRTRGQDRVVRAPPSRSRSRGANGLERIRCRRAPDRSKRREQCDAKQDHLRREQRAHLDESPLIQAIHQHSCAGAQGLGDGFRGCSGNCLSSSASGATPYFARSASDVFRSMGASSSLPVSWLMNRFVPYFW